MRKLRLREVKTFVHESGWTVVRILVVVSQGLFLNHHGKLNIQCICLTLGAVLRTGHIMESPFLSSRRLQCDEYWSFCDFFLFFPNTLPPEHLQWADRWHRAEGPGWAKEAVLGAGDALNAVFTSQAYFFGCWWLFFPLCSHIRFTEPRAHRGLAQFDVLIHGPVQGWLLRRRGPYLAGSLLLLWLFIRPQVKL